MNSAAIRTCARGEIQDDAVDLSEFSQPTISLVCKEVALAIIGHRGQWKKCLHPTVNKTVSLLIFMQYVALVKKGYSSINVQIVSNEKLEIMDKVAHWRGSTHDSRIFNESRLKQRFEGGEFKGRLLGDSGYACTPYLFTPVLHPATIKEEMYNRAHIHTRNSVERCFGVWKQRFRCLLRVFTTKLDNTKLYIVTLAILYNIAMQKQDLVPEAVESSVPVTKALNNTLRGNVARAAFINENF
ncbi:unnamed protein product [Euphydryas editha]|uniref:DDE Tnp4 domain-containing protein n=1 Tax=Euphydryas editha TaxID=104508 RepID=A0AAU9VEA6_EUPED|nr:unnamed protein product [Euphydryas editha]